MRNQLVTTGIIALLVCVGLSGCTNNPLDTEKNKFVGTWKSSNTSVNPNIYNFFSNGTCSMGLMGGSYAIKDGKLVITVQEQVIVTMVYDYSFSNNDKTLTLTNTLGGSPAVYTKQ